MIALVGAVVVASLLGSVHCAGMCGAFVAVAVAGEGASRRAMLAAYNLGRLATYVALGIIAGLVGAAMDAGGAMVGVQRIAAAGAGAVMVLIGVAAVLRYTGVRIASVPVPGLMRRLAMKGHRAAALLPPVHRAAAIGLLTTLLPCGWLYAFVITAAGTGSPAWGAVTMAAFWAGTLPMMIGLGLGVQALTGPLRRHLPLATSLLLVGVGIWTIAGRLPFVGVALADSAGAGAGGAVVRVNQLNAKDSCPLCK